MASYNTEEYHYDKQTLLSEHESLLARTQTNTIDSSIQTTALQSSKLIELNNLKAIKISDLTPGLNNANKLIYSTQITPIAVAEVICFVIEDEYSNVCRVSIPANADTLHLVTGARIAFSNPIYKMAFNGRYSLIVHNISNISLLQFDSLVKQSSSEQIALNLPTKSSLFSLNNPIPLAPNVFNTNVRQTLEETPNFGSFLFTTNPGVSSAVKNQFQFQFNELNVTQISPRTFDTEFLGKPMKPLKKSEKQQQQQQQQPQPQNPFQMSSIEVTELYNLDIPSTDGYKLIQNGNTLFKEGRYLQAIVQYTCAINTNSKDAAYYQNRALCYFKVEELETALYDLLKANLLEPENAKIQYLIALTWSKMGNHKLCLYLLTKIKSKDNVDSQAVENLIRREKLLVENIKGKFDFEKIRQSFIENIPSEIGDYIGPIQILDTLKGGRGVFTTRRVKKGENICVVRPIEFVNSGPNLCACHSCSRIRFNSAVNKRSFPGLIEGARRSKLTTVRLASLCDKSIKKVNIELFSGCGFEFAKNFDTSLYPLDTLQLLMQKSLVLQFDHLNISFLYSNLNISFQNQPHIITIHAVIYGIWLLTSFIKHSCIPNVVRIYIGDICIVRAITDIPEGGEIFTSYLPLSLYPNTQDRSNYVGYKCDCKLCEFERSSNSTEAYTELIFIYNYLYHSVNPNECFVDTQLLAENQKVTQGVKEELSKEKWLEIKNKLIHIAKKILLTTTKTEYISICFRSSILILFRVSHSKTDVLNLALEVESYFSPLEPQTYIIFWNTFYRSLLESETPKDPRFKHVEKNFIETRKLFT